MFNATPLVRDTLPLLTQNDDQKSPLDSPSPSPRYRFNFDQFRGNDTKLIGPTFVQPIEPEIAKNPSLSNRNIRSVDFSSGSGARRMDARTGLHTRSMPAILLYSMNRKLGPRIYIYFFSFFLFSESRARFHSPSPPPPRVNLKRVRGKRGNASLFDPHEIRRDVEYEGGEGMIRGSIHRWFKGSTGQKGDRWWRSVFFYFFIFFFFPPPRKTNEIEIYFLYTRVIKFNVTGKFWILSKCMYEKLDEGWINDAERLVITLFDSN